MSDVSSRPRTMGLTTFGDRSRSSRKAAARSRSTGMRPGLYANRRPEDAAFLDELQALQRENPHYTLVATMTAMEQSHRPWRGEKGPIQPGHARQSGAEELQPIYYVAGPPGMVTSVQTMLKSTGVTNEDVRAEKFDGY